MISYAGVKLTALKPALRAECDRWWADHWPGADWSHEGYLARDLHHLPVPAPPPPVPVRPGVLYWPVGYASRWATFHAFVTGEQLDRIRLAVGGPDPATATADEALLVLSSGDDPRKTVSAYMWPLPARPVFQSGADEVYLLTLVDERYLWWHNTPQDSDKETGTAWSTLLYNGANDIHGNAAVSVPAAYGVASSRWVLRGVPRVVRADAACRTVGLRFVRRLTTGSVARAPRDALALDAAQWETWEGEVCLGGRFSAADVAWWTGDRLNVTWADAPTPSTSSTSPGTFVLRDTLALPEYDGLPPGRGYASAGVWSDISCDASGAVQAAYATQAATDFFLWALALTDCTFRGIVPWEPTGLEERIEWEHTPERVCTRVVRSRDHERTRYGRSRVRAADLDGYAVAPYSLLYRANNTTTDGVGWPDQLSLQYAALAPPGSTGYYFLRERNNAGTLSIAWAAGGTVTGSRGGNAALASLLSTLATLGLITDSTTA